MNNYMKTIISGLKQWVSSQKSDWNQNDSSAVNFIKNRPFYSEEKEKVLFSSDALSSQEFALSQPLIKGSTYTVVFNGVTYQCLAREYDGYIMIGNNAIYEYDGGIETDTEEPFAIEHEVNSTNAYLYTDDTITEAPSLSILGTVEEVHQIDKKYVPMPDLADVAHTGSYYDLMDTPYIPWDTVQYATSQSLPDSNKKIARENIGAIEKKEVENLLQTEDFKVPSAIWNDICYGDKFVAVSRPGNSTEGFKVAYSTSGKDWTTVENLPGESSVYTRIVYGNGIYATNQGLFSVDAISWTPYTLPADITSYRIYYCNDRFILVSQSKTDKIYYSTDLNSWTETKMPLSLSWTLIYYGNGLYLLSGRESTTSNWGYIMTSTDFTNWTQTSHACLTKCVYGAGKFVATPMNLYSYFGNDYLYTSTDGLTWTIHTVEEYYPLSLVYFDNKFIISSYMDHRSGTAKYLYSFDGENWFINSGVPGNCMASHNSTLIDFGQAGTTTDRSNVYKYSSDGLSWTSGQVTWFDEDIAKSLGKAISPYVSSTNDLAKNFSKIATTSTAGLMGAADKAKLDKVAQNLRDGKAVGSMRSVTADAETDTYSLGRDSMALGEGTSASGSYSFAAGKGAKASGPYSYAQGFMSYATAKNSHAEGFGVTAASECQHAQGKNNIIDSSGKYLHIVGNGSNSAPSNAHTIDWDGVGWYKGDLKVGGTGQDDETAKSVLLTPSEEETLEMLTEMELVDPVGEEGFIYTDENGVMYTLI